MSIKPLINWTSIAMTLGSLAVCGCSNSQNSNSNQPAPTTQAAATQPAANSQTASSAADDPFHITKPTGSLDGVPPPPDTPSPESINATKLGQNQAH